MVWYKGIMERVIIMKGQIIIIIDKETNKKINQVIKKITGTEVILGRLAQLANQIKTKVKTIGKENEMQNNSIKINITLVIISMVEKNIAIVALVEKTNIIIKRTIIMEKDHDIDKLTSKRGSKFSKVNN